MLQSAQPNFRHSADDSPSSTNSDYNSNNNNSNNDDYDAIKQHTMHSRRRQRANVNVNAMLWLCSCCLFFLLANINKTNAVPMSIFTANNFALPLPLPLLQRNIRDTSIATQQATAIVGRETAFSTESSSSSSSTSAADQPADQCLIDGVLMAQSSVFCEPQMGCRAIQKTGHCCPDYKCDCERDGKVYANGDKLVDPETPCTVCYCKGGEILCSPVTCFQRNDCTPKFIPGRCCPEYDNCPVAVSESSTSANWTQSATSDSSESTTISTSTPLPDLASQQQDEKSKITIKEITKPTEIRMSNKIIPIQHQLSKNTQLNVSTTEATHHEPSTTTAATTSKQPPISSGTSPNIETPKNEDEVSSSTAKTQQESITVLSSVAATDIANKVNIKREYLFSREGLPLLNLGSNNENGVASPVEEPETAGSDNVFHIVLTTDAPRLPSTEGSGNNELLAPSTEGFLIDTTEGPISKQTSSGSSTTPSTIELESELEVDNNSTTQSTESASVSTEEVSSQRSTTDVTHEDDEATLPVESNPAYPSLPEDDFSLRDVNFPLSETDDIVEPDEQRSIGGSLFKHVNKPDEVDNLPSSSTDGSGDGDIGDFASSTTAMPTAETAASAKLALMLNSREDTSEEMHISNSTDFQTQQPATSTNKSVESNVTDDSLEAESLECLAGSSNSDCYSKLLNNTRESTTPRVNTRYTSTTELDIDELAAAGAGSGDGNLPIHLADDPKLDAESLKLDEKDDNGIATIDAPTKTSGVLSIGRTNPAQDKTIIESVSPVEAAKVEGSGRLQLHRVFI